MGDSYHKNALQIFKRSVLGQDVRGLKALLAAVNAETKWELLQTAIGRQHRQAHTAVYLAAVRGYDAVLEQVLQADHDMPPEIKNKYITSVSSSAPAAAGAAGHQGLQQLLQEHCSASIDIMSVAAAADSNYPALFAAARRGNLTAVQQLLARAGVQDSRSKSQGTVPLIGSSAWLAAPASALEAAIKRDSWRQENLAVVQQLAAASPRVQMEGKYGFYALAAALNSRLEVLQVLLDAGAALTYHSHRTILTRAVSCGSPQKVQAVLAAMQHRGFTDDQLKDQLSTALMTATIAGSLELVETLLRAGAPAGSRDSHGRTPLCSAAQRGNQPLVELLLQWGADVNGQCAGCGATALHEAARSGNTGLVSCLLAAGADVSLADQSGSTALEAAAEKLHTDTINCLMAHSAQPPTASLVKSAWKSAAAVATGGLGGGYDSQSDCDTEEEDHASQPGHASGKAAAKAQRQQQHSLVISLLKAAVARDCSATVAALSECAGDLTQLRKELERPDFSDDDNDDVDISPEDIRRPEGLMQAMAQAWLQPICDLTTERAALQHLLVAAAGSSRQLQEAAGGVEGLAERERQVALREQQVSLREQQLLEARGQQQQAPALRCSKQRRH